MRDSSRRPDRGSSRGRGRPPHHSGLPERPAGRAQTAPGAIGSTAANGGIGLGSCRAHRRGGLGCRLDASRFRSIIEYTEEPIVSSDVIGNPHSAIFDGLSTQVVGGNLLKTLTWYDNGWGYAQRAVALVQRPSNASGGACRACRSGRASLRVVASHAALAFHCRCQQTRLMSAQSLFS